MGRKVRAVLFAIIAAITLGFSGFILFKGGSFDQVIIIPMLGFILALIIYAVTNPFVKKTPTDIPSFSIKQRNIFIVLVVIATGVMFYVGKPWKKDLPLPLSSNQDNVSRSSMGDDWPLTVESGRLMCLDGGSVVFEVPSGIRYAVNGTAKDLTVYSDIDEIWAADTSMGISGIKKDIGLLINRGLELCNES